MDCRVFAPRKEPLLLSAVNDSVVRISPPSRWNGAPTTVRKHRCSLMGCCFAWVGEPKGCRGRAESPLQASMCVNLAGSSPQPGLTRRLRRERWGFRPEGGSTFFRSERKYQRKPAARRLQRRPAPLRVAGFGLREPFGLSSTSVRCAHPPGKRLLLPILTAGLAMSRAMELGSFHQLLERARARLFPPSKWAGLFPFAAYRRSVPPQLAWGRLKRRCLGCFGVVSVVLRHRKTDLNR